MEKEIGNRDRHIFHGEAWDRRWNDSTLPRPPDIPPGGLGRTLSRYFGTSTEGVRREICFCQVEIHL